METGLWFILGGGVTASWIKNTSRSIFIGSALGLIVYLLLSVWIGFYVSGLLREAY